MNNHSTRWSLAAALLAAVVLAGCGGDSDSGTSSKADWEKKHGSVVAAVSTDVDAANGALDKGERPVILNSCNQLKADMADAHKALPVPDATADSSLRAAFDAIDTAVPTCLQGAQVASDAHLVEQAQREMKTARDKLDEAQTAIAAWS